MDSLSHQDVGVQDGNLDADTSPARLQGTEVQIVKRLLREVFADLVGIKQQLQDLAPRSEDADLVIPHTGALVRPTPKRFAAALHYKANAQLSGALDFGCVLPWSSSPAAHARGHTRSALARAGVVASGPPQLTALLQSVWGQHKQQSLTARLSSPLGAPGPLQATTASQPLAAGASSAGLQLDQLLFRQEVKPGLKIMVAALGGSLAHLSRRLNPSADFGCTRAMRHGHDVPMVLEGGSGGAALMSSGPLSLSTGHFVSGADCQGLQHHSLAQLSVHSTRRSTLSLVLSHMHASRGLPQQQQQQQQRSSAPGASGSKQECSSRHGAEGNELRYAGLLAPSCTSSGDKSSTGRSAQSLPPQPAPNLRLGVAGSVTAWDALVLSGWHAVSAMLCAGREGASTGGGSSSSSLHSSLGFSRITTGVRASSVPDPHGRVFAATLAATANPARPSAAAATAAQGGTRSIGGRGDKSNRNDHAFVAEVSASIPVQDGLSICPGATLLREQGETTVGFVLQSTWRF